MTSGHIPVDQPGVHRAGAVSLALVRLATTLLPAGDVRRRYRWELVADLQYLDRPHQLTYATGFATTAWALRRELAQEADPMNDTTMTPSIPLMCRLNLHHKWVKVTNPEDNHQSTRCLYCGKDSPHLGTQGIIG